MCTYVYTYCTIVYIYIQSVNAIYIYTHIYMYVHIDKLYMQGNGFHCENVGFMASNFLGTCHAGFLAWCGLFQRGKP